MKAVETFSQIHPESASWIENTLHNMQRDPCRQNTDGFLYMFIVYFSVDSLMFFSP